MLTREQENELKEVIGIFARREFGDGAEPVDVTNLDRIPIAYTEIGEDEYHEVQMIINVPDLQLEQYIDGILTDFWQYADFNGLLREIENISFDELVALGFNAEKIVYGKSKEAQHD